MVAAPVCTWTPEPTYPTRTPTMSATEITEIRVRWPNDVLPPSDSEEDFCNKNDILDAPACAEQVYDDWYDAHSQISQPLFRNLVAVVFRGELGPVNTWPEAHEAFGNYLVNICGDSGCNRAQIMTWLAGTSFRHYYRDSGQAQVGQLIESPDKSFYESIADTIMSQLWPAACVSNPDRNCYWGNWSYHQDSSSSYQRIRRTTIPVVRCSIYQTWRDNNNNGIVDTGDWWQDYVFAFTSYNQKVQLPGIGIYNSMIPYPPWLDDETKRHERLNTYKIVSCPGTADN